MLSNRIIRKYCRTQLFYSMQCPLFLVLLFVLSLVACPLWGQAGQKKMLTPEDYHLWGEVHIELMSPDENWAAYKVEYESGQDTLFVRNILSNKTYSFPGAENAVFTLNNLFICQSGEDVNVLNLSTSKIEKISGLIKFSYSEITQDLICLYGSGAKKKSMEIRSLRKGTSTKISKVNHYLLSPDGKTLAFTTLLKNKNSVAICYLKKPGTIKWLQKESTEKFIDLTWQKKGYSLAFIKQHDDARKNILYYYTLSNSKLYQLDALSDPNFAANWSITHDSFREIIISDDLQRICFAVKSNNAEAVENKNPKVEIWNGNDKWIYPDEKSRGNFQKKLKVALWQPVVNKTHIISSTELPNVMLTSALDYAVISNPKDYEPQFEIEKRRDFYIVNLKTFEKKIFLKKHTYNLEALNFSPQGKYFSYFKENNWWLYNPAADTHTNITAVTHTAFNGKKQELVPISVYGNPGWTLNDKQIILYDQYDIWVFTVENNSIKRLTKGRERQITYRILNPPTKNRKFLLYDGLDLESFDLDKALFLRAKGADGKTGCFIWNKSTGEKPIIYNESYIDEIKYNQKRHNIIFREQKFDLSPRLVSASDSSMPTCFFNSNPQQKNYFWGKSELIEYQNSKGRNLKGVLLYPAGYIAGKKYPMVVNIYEAKADELHLYQNPTFENEGGFNVTLMTLEGYFVLLPDIYLEFQNPGISATDCVVSAVQKVIEKGIVNPDKIGLLGHSFGGYESAFIITQTPLFATAIASGAITDLVSFYHTVGPRSGIPDMWRLNEQWNMGGTPHDIPMIYQANSALSHVTNIQKPILLWSGKNDKQVDTRQSLEFYLALRRLNKKNMLLFYPDEGHVIADPGNQKDVTVRMIEWFNYFLKDDHSYHWINQGIE